MFRKLKRFRLVLVGSKRCYNHHNQIPCLFQTSTAATYIFSYCSIFVCCQNLYFRSIWVICHLIKKHFFCLFWYYKPIMSQKKSEFEEIWLVKYLWPRQVIGRILTVFICEVKKKGYWKWMKFYLFGVKIS